MDSDWSSLSPYLLYQLSEEMISTKNYKYFLQLGVVCTSWHNAIKQNAKLWQRIYSLIDDQVPLLLIPSEEKNYHSLYDITTSSFLKSKVFVPFDKRFAGSSRGWLVSVDKESVVTLYKPHYTSVEEYIDATTITLPSLLPREKIEEFDDKADYHVEKSLITADPLLNKDQCIVVLVLSFEGVIAYIRPSKDTKWSFIHREASYFVDVVHFNGQFYALDTEGHVVSFDITNSFGTEICNTTFVSKKTPFRIIDGKNYLVVSNGKLLQVIRVFHWKIYDYELEYVASLNDNEDVASSNNDNEDGSSSNDNKEDDTSSDDDEDEKSSDDDEDEKSSDDNEDDKSSDDYEDEKSSDDEEDDKSLKENMSRWTKSVKVLELDFDSRRWISTNNLGDDTALFLGDNASISTKASKVEGCEPNCIYFTHDADDVMTTFHHTVCDFGVYDLKSRRMTWNFKMEQHSLSKISKRIPIWISPYPVNNP